MIHYHRYDPLLRHEKIPNFEGYLRNPQFLNTEFLIKTRYNSFGLNDMEFSIEDLRGKEIILAVGDSHTYGYGVSKENSFPAIMNQYYSSDKIKVINAGTGGYQPDTYLNYIKYRAQKFSPDIILVGITIGSDMHSPTLYTVSEGQLIEKLVPEPGIISQIRRFMLRNSHAYSFTLRAIDQTFIGEILRDAGIFVSRVDDPLNAYDRAAYQQILGEHELIYEEILQLTEDMGAELFILLIPFREQVDDDLYRQVYGDTQPNILRFEFQEDVKKILDRQGIKYFDPLGTFRELNVNNTFYYSIDGHPNQLGYELLGNLTAQALIDAGFIEGR